MRAIYDFLRNTFFSRIQIQKSTPGMIHLYADDEIPVNELRKQLNKILSNHPQWDKQTASIQIAEAKRNHTSLHIFSGSHDSSGGLNFQMEVREKLIDFIDRNYPDCFVKTRIEKMAAGAY